MSVDEAKNVGDKDRERKTEQGYIQCSKKLPPDGVIVMTKIHDQHGKRNEQRLKRSRNLWWLPDGSIYVYYTPTHWKP